MFDVELRWMLLTSNMSKFEELGALMDRLEVVNQDVGGGVMAPKRPKKKGDQFVFMKGEITRRLNKVNELCHDRDNGAMGKSERHRIQMDQKIRTEVRSLKTARDELEALFLEETRKKKSKLTAEEVTARRQALSDLTHLTTEAIELATGHKPAESTSTYTKIEIDETSGELMSGGKPVAARTTHREELTEDQKMAMAQIRREEGKQDELLDVIDEGVGNLKALALGIREEATLQNLMLDDLDKDVDKAQAHITRVNDRMKETLAAVNSKSDRFCSYAICIVILLGLLTVLYNMLR